MAVLKCKKCKKVIGELDEDNCITKVKKKCPECGYLNEYKLKRNV
ncbi:hypothetical protein [Clostridium tyrobutyricum]|nr:hypothetical protein [Clostridium tyrobutyricum]